MLLLKWIKIKCRISSKTGKVHNHENKLDLAELLMRLSPKHFMTVYEDEREYDEPEGEINESP
jgi:hypothetical protein